MSSTVAFPPKKPVEVLTKSAPASFASLHAIIFSSRVKRAVSIMTLTIISLDMRLTSTTAAMSRFTAS
jgi:hypothetical protein